MFLPLGLLQHLLSAAATSFCIIVGLCLTILHYRLTCVAADGNGNGGEPLPFAMVEVAAQSPYPHSEEMEK